MKKIIILIALHLIGFNSLFSQADVYDGTKEVWIKGTGSADDPFLLESAKHLAFFNYVVSLGIPCGDSHFLLTTDIDLNGSENFQWVPIGQWQDEEACTGNVNVGFEGHFDGGNHVIKNMYINKVGYAGF